MSNKHICCSCEKMAVWFYLPGDETGYYCNECVPRGCDCNYFHIKEFDPPSIDDERKWIWKDDTKQTINLPFENHYTGYSGGLGPDNIEKVLQSITSHNNPATVFIDCESGVRTNNDFDLKKVKEYLEICMPFINI